MSSLSTHSISTIQLIDDFPFYCSLPQRVQEDVIAKLRCIDALLQAAKGQKQIITKQAALQLKASPGAIHRYVRSYRQAGWKGLIDERHAGVGAKGLPAQFKSYIAGLYDAHQRDNDDAAEVHRKVLDRWQLWHSSRDTRHAIPGYTECPSAMPATGYPHGWSYDRIRSLKPKPAERAMSKHGKKSASAYLPSVLTTRYGSRVMSRLLFDDQDYDNMLADGFLAIAGIDTVTRPVSFNCVDFLTARHIDHHLRLMYKDPAGTNKTLTQQEYVWFVIKQAQDHGWRTDAHATEYIFEHGTANSWSNKLLTSLGGHHSFEDALHAVSGGKAIINRSGKFEGPVFAGMCFRAQSSGNFKFKTWIESAFRLLRTYMQALPGPIGSHARVNGKEELYGIKLADNAILTAIKSCPDTEMQDFLVENFRRELLDLQTFSQLINSVYRAINFATSHKLEGWQRCGFTANFWRINEQSTHWFAESELIELYPDPEERSLILRKINARRDVLTKIEPICREAAFALEMQRDKNLLCRLPDPMVSLLLPREWAQQVRVAATHCFWLQNPLWPDTRDQYVASWDEKQRMITLDGGTNLLVYHNPFFDGRAQIHSLDGSYITTLYPTVRAEIFNSGRTLEQLKVRSKMSSAQEAHFKARMSDIAAHRTRAAADNKELHSLTKDRLDLTRESRRRTARAAQDACEQTQIRSPARADPLSTAVSPYAPPTPKADPFA